MTPIPSGILMLLLALLAFNAARILSKRWMRVFAFCCGVWELLAAGFLLTLLK